jgi:hypothetical protein
MKDTDAIEQESQRRNAELEADLRDAISFPPLPPSPAEVSDLILQTREHVQMLGWGNRERLYTESQVRAIMAECAAMAAARELEAENARLLTLARKRADYEASAAAHHAGKWHAAHEHHLTRYAAMRDLIDTLEGPNVGIEPRR